MTTKQLRQAIARLFPDTYNRWSWKRLLADFVDVHLEAHSIKCDRAKSSGQPAPVIPAELQAAAPLLARQQKLTYADLALGYYLLQLEAAALLRERNHYRAEAEGLHSVAVRSQDLADESITLLKNLTNSSPDSRPN